MRMKGVVLVSVLSILLVAMTALAATPKKSSTDWAKAQKPVNVTDCYSCHDTIEGLHSVGMHKDINCISCHNDLVAHLDDSENRPNTDMSWEACGTCHKDQMGTISTVTYHRPARDDKSQPTSRIPVWYDKLMAPHGFTKEHAITRPHALMLIDQYVVDRAFGGRFQPKNGWKYVLETGTVWDVLEDTHPEVPGQQVFLPQTATAANAVCMSCKTADHILDWAYMGDPGEGARFDRTSNPVELAKFTQHALNCFFCHDPHAAKPRIIRDALIDAISDPSVDNLYTRDPNHTKVEVITMGQRGFERKIGIMEEADSRLMCAQCHVEYNCNPGTNPETGATTGFNSRLTNHFPLKDVLELYDHYFNQLQFADFKHKFDSAWLWKGQHPEFETFYESVHSQAGVGCADCHMPAVRTSSGKLKYTNHFAQSPRYMMEATCLTSDCHSDWTAEQGVYVIDSIKAYTKSRMRKAEYWLSTLIDTIIKAEESGVSAAKLKEARTAHTQAHILWEYWTAENSDGFHNPSLARESITRSITISQNTIDMLNKEISSKRSAKK